MELGLYLQDGMLKYYRSVNDNWNKNSHGKNLVGTRTNFYTGFYQKISNIFDVLN